MTSKSTLSYAERARQHDNPIARKLFEIAEAKKSNVVVSADLTTTKELLELADRMCLHTHPPLNLSNHPSVPQKLSIDGGLNGRSTTTDRLLFLVGVDLGPYIAVLKTHIDIVSDFNKETVFGLKSLSEKHNFLIFEDRKFVDIGNTVQKQYHGGALRISEWAHLVNASILAGDGIVEALAQTGTSDAFEHKGERGLLMLAEMTTRGTFATGAYTKASIESAKKHSSFVIGFISNQALTSIETQIPATHMEDFIVFTTGVNRATKGDPLGQQYQTPEAAIKRGADFIISGRGIYATSDPIQAAKLYQNEGWAAYETRIKNRSTGY